MVKKRTRAPIFCWINLSCKKHRNSWITRDFSPPMWISQFHYILLSFINAKSKWKRAANQKGSIFCLHCIPVNGFNKRLLDNYIYKLKKVNNVWKKQGKYQNFEAAKLETNLECVAEMCYMSLLVFKFSSRAWFWSKPPGCPQLKRLGSCCRVVSRVHEPNFFQMNLHQNIASQLRYSNC